jgi:subtilase family serine protease
MVRLSFSRYSLTLGSEYGKLGMMVSLSAGSIRMALTLLWQGTTFLFSSGDYGVAGNGGNCMNGDGQVTSSGTVFTPGFPASCP